MKPRKMPETQEELLELFTYNDGKLISNRTNREVSFYRKKSNRWQVMVNGRFVFRSRVIWKMFNGYDPETIDHINGDKSDDRIENLRDIPLSLQMKNFPKGKRNKSGYVGVCKCKNKWRAFGSIGQQSIHLGVYDTIEEAAERRKQWEKDNDYHENHGR